MRWLSVSVLGFSPADAGGTPPAISSISCSMEHPDPILLVAQVKTHHGIPVLHTSPDGHCSGSTAAAVTTSTTPLPRWGGSCTLKHSQCHIEHGRHSTPSIRRSAVPRFSEPSAEYTRCYTYQHFGHGGDPVPICTSSPEW